MASWLAISLFHCDICSLFNGKCLEEDSCGCQQWWLLLFAGQTATSHTHLFINSRPLLPNSLFNFARFLAFCLALNVAVLLFFLFLGLLLFLARFLLGSSSVDPGLRTALRVTGCNPCRCVVRIEAARPTGGELERSQCEMIHLLIGHVLVRHFLSLEFSLQAENLSQCPRRVEDHQSLKVVGAELDWSDLISASQSIQEMLEDRSTA